jgi:hypothetical protein
MDRMQHWAADHAALLNAKLAGLKAGLKLTPDQEKLWAPFEAAVRGAAKLRMDQMKAMMDRMQRMREMMGQIQDSSDMKEGGPTGQTISPVDRLEAMAKGMSERGAAMLNLAEAAKPLYAGLDDSQKRLFGLPGGDALMMGHGHRAMGMIGGMGRAIMGEKGMMARDGAGMGMMDDDGMDMGMMGGERGMKGQCGMGMIGREPSGMNMMGSQSGGEEDSSDDE